MRCPLLGLHPKHQARCSIIVLHHLQAMWFCPHFGRALKDVRQPGSLRDEHGLSVNQVLILHSGMPPGCRDIKGPLNLGILGSDLQTTKAVPRTRRRSPNGSRAGSCVMTLMYIGFQTVGIAARARADLIGYPGSLQSPSMSFHGQRDNCFFVRVAE